MIAKVKRYDDRVKQYQQNRLFQCDQKRFYHELSGEVRGEKIIPDTEESDIFWSSIWANEAEHNRQAEWLNNVKENLNHEKQQNLMIDKQKIAQQSKKIANWRAPGPDGVQGYWFKNLSACHQRIADQLNEILKGDDIPERMTYGRTVFCLKNPSRGGVVDNFRPISCLPLMWKLMKV